MSNKLTVDEIVTKLWKNGVNQELPDYYPDTMTVIEAKDQLSQIVDEIIGSYNYTQDAYGTAEAENNLIELQRQRAIDRGFVLENIDE